MVGIRRSTCGTYYIGCQSENAPHSQGKQFKELFIISGTQRGRGEGKQEWKVGGGSISIFKLPHSK